MNVNDQLSQFAIDLASALKVPNKTISQYLKVKISDKVKENDVLAVKKSFLGLNKIEIKSPLTGVILNIDTENGILIIDSRTPEKVSENQEIVTEISLSDTISENEVSLENEVEVDSQLNAEEPSEETEAKIEIFTVVDNQEVSEPEDATQKQEENNTSDNFSSDDSFTLNSIAGFGAGMGYSQLSPHDLNTSILNSQLRDRIIVTTAIPTVMQVYRASAVGISGFVVIGEQYQDSVFNLKHELEGKVRLGLALLPSIVDIDKFENCILTIKENTVILTKSVDC